MGLLPASGYLQSIVMLHSKVSDLADTGSGFSVEELRVANTSFLRRCPGLLESVGIQRRGTSPPSPCKPLGRNSATEKFPLVTDLARPVMPVWNIHKKARAISKGNKL